MKRIIHHVRKQPERIRKHILHVATIAFAALLFLLWVATLGNGYRTDGSAVKAEKENINEPLSALKANFVDGYKSLNQ